MPSRDRLAELQQKSMASSVSGSVGSFVSDSVTEPFLATESLTNLNSVIQLRQEFSRIEQLILDLKVEQCRFLNRPNEDLCHSISQKSEEIISLLHANMKQVKDLQDRMEGALQNWQVQTLSKTGLDVLQRFDNERNEFKEAVKKLVQMQAAHKGNIFR